MDRRQFLKNIYEVSGVIGLVNIGLSLDEAKCFAGPIQTKHQAAIAALSTQEGGNFTSTFRSYSQQNGESVDTLVCDAPSGLTSGDMIIAFTAQETTTTITPPAGFTQIDQAIASGDIQSWYKEAGGSEPGTYTWGFASLQSGCHVFMVSVQKDGGSWVTPTTSDYHNSSTGAAATLASGLVNTQDGSCFVNGWYHDGSAFVSVAPPDQTITTFSNAGSCRAVVYYQDIVTGGSDYTRTITWSAADDNAGAVVVVYAQ